MLERKQELATKIAQLSDVRSRLEIQKDASKLCVAESIKDFHEQMQLVLKEKVPLEKLGPEFMSIDRAKLQMSLDISKMRPLSKREEEEVDKRVSERIVKLSSRRSSPGKPRAMSPLTDTRKEENK